jgi:uncharacterized repeat protein (TIGR03803 family)
LLVALKFIRATSQGKLNFEDRERALPYLFGTTAEGGSHTCQNGSIGCGTVFELSPPNGRHADWTETVLWDFGSGDDGEFPEAGVIADKWGNLYGTTINGGANSFRGTVFELSPPSGQNTQWRETIR